MVSEMMPSSSHIGTLIQFGCRSCMPPDSIVVYVISELCNEWNQVNCLGMFSSTYSAHNNT